MIRAGLLFFVPLALLTACQECSTESCTDYAKVAINTVDGTWIDGHYSLELEADDAVYSCTFTTPDDAPDETGAPRPIECTSTMEAFLVPFCDWYELGSDICNPLPGKFFLEARAPGTPKNLHFVLSRDDKALLDRTMNIYMYGTVQPNGAECGPTCHQYGSGYTVP